MKDILRPMLELFVALPGLLLAYFPVKSYLKQSPRNLAAWLLPLMAGLGVGGGLVCYRLRISTVFVLAGITLLAIVLYTRTLRISLWKSGTIALSICAVFACLNSLSRAVSAAIVLHMQLPPDGPWFCFAACVFYNAVCWVFVLAASYPSTHAVRAMVEDDNFAQTWYVFWVLPLVFILLNLFMIPRYQTTLQTGRVLQGYIVLSIALLVLLLWFNTIFLLMANSLNRNARLQQENQLLSMQQQRYESLKTAIEEARQARHDMRHQLNHISALAEAGELEDLKSYLAKTVSRIPNLDMCFCENRTADSVVGYYCALAKREDIPFRTKLDLPESLPILTNSSTLAGNEIKSPFRCASQNFDPSKYFRHLIFPLIFLPVIAEYFSTRCAFNKIMPLPSVTDSVQGCIKPSLDMEMLLPFFTVSLYIINGSRY